MPDDGSLKEIESLRTTRKSVDADMYRVQLELQKLRVELKQRAAKGPVREIVEQIKARERERDRLKGRLDEARAGLDSLIGGLYVDPHPRDLVALRDDGIPFLLMPVRIETRFVGGSEMWLRIYPDDIAIHTHEKILTTDEVADGKAYWLELFDAIKANAADMEARKKSAWSDLITRFPPQRAAWIALSTEPTNWSADLAAVPNAAAVDFPVHGTTKTNAWSRAPRTNVMPDKFVVLLYEGATLVDEIVGELIPDELFVGPDPFAAKDAFQNKDGKLGFGASYEWMSNFDQAIKAGLGFKIALTESQRVNGFDRILVLGLCLSASETESQVMVEELIDNHHYSPKGFSIVPQGSPTNNTDQNGSGYSRNDPFGNTSYVVETGAALFDETYDCDGRNLADALGISYTPLQNVMHSNGRDYREAVTMNKALYPGTLGYYFEALMRPVLDPREQDALREFFVNRVTGRGPLPAIRVGDQPYGVLLTSDFSKWNEPLRRVIRRFDFYPKLVSVLRAYQELWNKMLPSLSFVGKQGSDSSAVLMDVLGLYSGSVSFAQRNAYSTDDLINQANFQAGGRYVEDLRKSFRSKNELLSFLQSLGATLTDEDGQLQVPQILRLVYHHRHTTLDAANLIDAVPLAEDRLVRNYDTNSGKNYLHWLAEATDSSTLESQNFGVGVTPPNALLYLMLRKSLLDQLHNAAARYVEDRGIPVAETSRARNFLNIRPEPSLSKWEVMKAPVSVVNSNTSAAHITVAEFLLGKTNPAEATFLNEVRSAIADLAKLPTARLERCFTEHIDTCSYRLDAWQTALFHARLQEQRGIIEGGDRSQRRKGIYLGAYGWVEHVMPSSKRQLVREKVHEKLQPKDGAPLYEYTDNGGFVHAPSLNHASAAAVLRSGYMAHASQLEPDVMAVNISSERVRRAMTVLQGIRQGQTVEALLGYQFERGMHDRASADNSLNLNLYIYSFRDQYPYEQHRVKQQGNDESDDDYEPQVSIAASNVVNGIKLAEVSESDLGNFLNTISGLTSGERAAIIAERDKLSDTLDSIKDLLLSESVYQLVQGNFDRTGATMNALQEARIPADIEVVNTPRSNHFSFTNRVMLQIEPLDPAAAQNNPWTPIAMTPRAKMEAGLNKWLGSIIGKAADIVFRVNRVETDGTLTGAMTLLAEDLKVQPIDLVYMTGNDLNTGESKPGEEPRTAASELESRIAFVYRKSAGLADNIPIRIEFLQPTGLVGKKTLGEIMPLLRMLRALIVESRPLNAEDFNPPAKKSISDPGNAKGYDIAELEARIQTVKTSLTTLLASMRNVPVQAQIKQSDGTMKAVTKLGDAAVELDATDTTLAAGPVVFLNADAIQLQQMLIDAANHGIAYAFPSAVSPASDAEKLPLLEQGRSIINRLAAALDKGQSLIAELKPDASNEKRVSVQIEAAQQLLGKAFAILPQFIYNNETDILQSHAHENQLLDHATNQLAMSFPVDEWLQNAAHVRPKVARWEYVRTLSETVGASAIDLHPVQVPFRVKDSWIAVEFPETYESVDDDGNPIDIPFTISQDTLSATIHGSNAFVAGVEQSGFLIDDWTEVIPAANETTGIAFNYNQPNAMPPQALLLAVTPAITGHWDWSNLVGVLEDTLLRAKLRAVEPDLIDKQPAPELNALLPALLASYSEYDLDIALDYRLNLASITAASPIMTALSSLDS